MSLCLLSHRSLLKGDDEPKTLPYAIASVCPIGADVRQTSTKSNSPKAGDIRVELRDSGREVEQGESWHQACKLSVLAHPENPDSRETHLLAMFLLFNQITVRDGVDPMKAHQAFLEIDEYRKTIAWDMLGKARL